MNTLNYFASFSDEQLIEIQSQLTNPTHKEDSIFRKITIDLLGCFNPINAFFVAVPLSKELAKRMLSYKLIDFSIMKNLLYIEYQKQHENTKNGCELPMWFSDNQLDIIKIVFESIHNISQD